MDINSISSSWDSVFPKFLVATLLFHTPIWDHINPYVDSDLVLCESFWGASFQVKQLGLERVWIKLVREKSGYSSMLGILAYACHSAHRSTPDMFYNPLVTSQDASDESVCDHLIPRLRLDQFIG